jgi:hypothetical protein
MKFLRRRDRPAPPEHLVTTWEPVPRAPLSEPEEWADPMGDIDYAAIRRIVLRHVPTLEDAIRHEEDATAMHLEPTTPYVLIEDVVWPHLRRAAAVGPAQVRPYGALIAEMLGHRDPRVPVLAGIGLIEQIGYCRPVREAFVAAGFARLLGELG